MCASTRSPSQLHSKASLDQSSIDGNKPKRNHPSRLLAVWNTDYCTPNTTRSGSARSLVNVHLQTWLLLRKNNVTAAAAIVPFSFHWLDRDCSPRKMVQLHARDSTYWYSHATRMGVRAGHQLGIRSIEIACSLGTAAGSGRFYEQMLGYTVHRFFIGTAAGRDDELERAKGRSEVRPEPGNEEWFLVRLRASFPDLEWLVRGIEHNTSGQCECSRTDPAGRLRANVDNDSSRGGAERGGC
jgi:hypothetical protein